MWLGLINVLEKDSEMKCHGQLITGLKIRMIGLSIRGQKKTKDQVCYSIIREAEGSREG